MNAAGTAVSLAITSATLPDLIDRAVKALTNARSAAEVLEARDLASVAYDIAKKTARLGKAKKAHDGLIAAAHRTQADALEIEAQAKRRLADEYDAAQERGEVMGPKEGTHRPKGVGVCNANAKGTADDIGLSRLQVYEAREVRDAEEADPGIVRRILDEALEVGQEPTRAKVKRAVKAKSKRKRQPRRDHNSSTETQHDRDLRSLRGIWESACVSAREEFLNWVSTQ